MVERALSVDVSRRVNDIGMSSIEGQLCCRVRINMSAWRQLRPIRSGRTAHVDGGNISAMMTIGDNGHLYIEACKATLS